MAVKKNLQQSRKAFVQAKLGQTGVEATPEQKAKLRERFNTLSQTKQGRTKIAQALLPTGTAEQRKTLKASIRPPKTGTSTTGTSTTGTSTTGTSTTGTSTTGKTNVGYVPGYKGIINNPSLPSNNYSSSTTVPSATKTTTTTPRTTTTTTPRTTTTTTVPKSTTSTTVPQTTTTTTVKQSNAFKSTGPPSTSSNEKDLTVPIVGGILVTGAAAVGTKAFLSSETNIDRLTRVRQNDLARQFKASQLTNSSSLTLADRPQFASVKDQRATAAAKTAAASPKSNSVISYVVGTRAAAAARTAPGATGGTRSVLEGLRSFMGGGLRKGAK